MPFIGQTNLRAKWVPALGERTNNGRPQLLIRDLLSATAVTAVSFAIVLRAASIVANPNKFADSLGHQNAALMMMACTIGIVGFPILILTAGYLALRRTNSPLKIFYASILIGLAVASITFAYIVARACAYAIA